MSQFDKPPMRGVFAPGALSVDEIPPVTGKSIFSKSFHEMMRRKVNALWRFNVNPPTLGRLLKSDRDVTLDLQALVEEGLGGGGGNMRYRGLYSASADYAIDDCVYTGTTPATRYFYICEIVNGVSTSVQTPNPSESGTIYWRVIAQPPAGSVQELTFSAFGFGGSNDYITCSGEQVRLPPLLRFSVASRVVYGQTIMYSSYNSSSQNRVATLLGTSVTQYITPQYVSGDKVYVSTVSGVLQDINADGRVFAGP